MGMGYRADEIEFKHYCDHCGHLSPMRLQFSDQCLDPNGVRSSFFLSSCGTCDRPLLFRSDEAREKVLKVLENSKALWHCDVIWPHNPRLHHSVPDEIRAHYSKASRVRGETEFFAVGIRRALEALCKERDVWSGALAKSLGKLADKQIIPPLLAEMTDVLRILGNAGAHDSGEQFSNEYGLAIDDFFRAIVEYVYVGPYRLDEFRKKLEEARSAAPQNEESETASSSVSDPIGQS